MGLQYRKRQLATWRPCTPPADWSTYLCCGSMKEGSPWSTNMGYRVKNENWCASARWWLMNTWNLWVGAWRVERRRVAIRLTGRVKWRGSSASQCTLMWRQGARGQVSAEKLHAGYRGLGFHLCIRWGAKERNRRAHPPRHENPPRLLGSPSL